MLSRGSTTLPVAVLREIPEPTVRKETTSGEGALNRNWSIHMIR